MEICSFKFRFYIALWGTCHVYYFIPRFCVNKSVKCNFFTAHYCDYKLYCILKMKQWRMFVAWTEETQKMTKDPSQWQCI